MKRLLLAVSLLLPLKAAAVLPYGMTDAELAALPPLCMAKMKGNNPSNYVAQFGAHNWGQMHHYCEGLKFVNRARTYPKDRRFYLNNAKGEYRYVISHTTPDLWFRPQVYVELARVHMQLGETAEAQSQLHAAIAFNRGFEAAYVSLIELQVGMGTRSAALETATEGLKYLPESKRLQKAYLDNGGKKPFPEPVVKAESPATATPSSSGSAAQANAPQTEAVAAEPVSAESQQTNADPTVERGCRFCPPDEIQQRWRESFQTGQ
ncbi:hypothetical protein [Thauera sp.]|uniref:tetratricopeptide repeat protein n=1 Tax=unclassified Thauera TaxID=2609274 RepID=UPI002B896156|nr:hypothetical protein [Thauera sp.]HRP26086.1 hypothetical protein [Thauera sp.]